MSKTNKKEKKEYRGYYLCHKDLIDKTVYFLKTIKGQLKQLKEYTYIVETNIDSLMDLLDVKKWNKKHEKKK